MYTVGIKRRWWFGYQEYQVKAHSWKDERLILDLLDGSQIHLAGVQSIPIKVYPNFWIHLHSLPTPKQSQAVRPEPVLARPVSRPEPVREEPRQEDEPSGGEEPTPYDYVRPEVKRAAAERVRGILQKSEFSAGLSS